MGECSNKLEFVAFASSRNFRRRSTPRKGTLCNFLNFYENHFCVSSVRADFAYERTKDVRAHTHTNTHTHTHTHTHTGATLSTLCCRISAFCNVYPFSPLNFQLAPPPLTHTQFELYTATRRIQTPSILVLEIGWIETLEWLATCGSS